MCGFVPLVFVLFTICFTTEAQTQKSATCAVPRRSVDKTFTIFDADERQIENERVPKNGFINLQCESGYIFPDGKNTSVSNCRPTSRGGQWEPAIKPCVQCGLPKQLPLIDGGPNATLGEFPWHVAIYSVPRKYILICGGTLIAANIVLSAAHCFYDEIAGKPSTVPTDYVIVVGKLTRNYATIDSPVQKRLEISKILFTEKPYDPETNGYFADISLIVLKERAVISTYVLPACFRAYHRSGFDPGSGVTGILAGWGADRSGDLDEILKTTKLPYVHYNQCSGLLPGVTHDKFCAGSDQAPRPGTGDSGGGLIFKDSNNFYYIRGIVSTTERFGTTSVTSFTDISYYQDWIDRILREVSEPEPPDIAVAPLLPFKKANRIASIMCNEYERYRYLNSTTLKSATIGEPGKIAPELHCTTTDRLVSTRVNQTRPAELNAYPHMALIGYGDTLTDPEIWQCSGSLISDQFILSAALCVTPLFGEKAKWAALGLHDRSVITRDLIGQNLFRIMQHIYHYEYRPETVYNDIALYKLEYPIQLSSTIRPICLNYVWGAPQSDTKTYVTGWGEEFPGGNDSKVLLETNIFIFDANACVNKYTKKKDSMLPKGFNSTTTICGKDPAAQIYGFCHGVSLGSPMQKRTPKKVCMWTQIGIASYELGNCDQPTIYTRVLHYLPWIQSLIWPNVTSSE